MPRTALAGRAVLIGAVLTSLAACGGGGGYGNDSSAASDEPAASSSSGGSDFCSQAAGLDQRVEQALSDAEGDDPSVRDAFAQIAEELRAMDPPEQIASDWDAMAAGLDRMAEAFADFDITDPQSLAALDEAEGNLSSASEHVETYLRDECGIEP